MLCGMTLAILFPVFTEPDGQYHFDRSCYMANVVIDRSNLDDARYAQDKVFHDLKKGNYFKNFFLTKRKTVDKSDVVDVRAAHPGIYFEYLIQSVGVWLGYHIYPSVGVMVVTARILAVFAYAVAVYFLIRYVKRGKRAVGLVALAPSMMISNFSLSYDMPSFLACVFVFTVCLNAVLTTGKFKRNELLLALLSLVSIFIFGKKNGPAILFLMPVILGYRMSTIYPDLYEKLLVFIRKWRVFVSLFVVIIGALGFIALGMFLSPGTSDVHILQKFVNSIVSHGSSPISIGAIVGNANSPWADAPYWIGILWFLCFLVTIYYEFQVELPKWVGFGFLGAYFLNLVAMMMQFVSFTWGNFEGGHEAFNPLSPIDGLQGRYFMPFFVCLTVLPVLVRFETTLTKKKIDRFNIFVVFVILSFFIYVSVFHAYIYHIQSGT
jgi:uncharacterized membrane protein